MKKTGIGFLLCLCAVSAFAEWACPELVAKVSTGELREARASWWGFDKEDSTRYLQAAIDSGAAKLIVEKMPSPWVTRPLFARSNQTVIFEKGVELVAKKGEFKGLNDCLFSCMGVTNVVISGYGATFRMHKPDYYAPPYKRGEWRHTLKICGSRNITAEGLTLLESGGDGIYISSPTPETTSCDIVIRDCVCDRNHRQGLSVISARNLLVENCVFKNTRGVAPEDGVDFEPNNAGEHFVNCILCNCVSENNAGNGFELALSQSRNTTTPCSIRFENCRTVGDCMGIKVRTRCRAEDGDYPTGTIDFVGCMVSKPRYEAVEIMQNPENAFKVSLTDCTFESIGTANPDAPAIVLTSPFADDPKPAMPKVKRLKWPDRGKRQPFLYSTMNFAALGEESLPILAAETANAEVVDLKPGKVVSLSPLRFRHHLRLAAYADRARRVTIRGEHVRVGPPVRQPLKKPVAITDASGKKIATIPLLDFGPSDLSFDAPAAGFYFLEITLGGHSYAVEETDAPLAVDCSLWMRWKHLEPQSLIDATGSLFVPLRAGGRVEIRASGSHPNEKVAFSVADPSGKTVFEDTALLGWSHYVSPVAGSDGMWKVSFGRPSRGGFEDFCVVVAGVRPFLFFSPEKYWF